MGEPLEGSEQGRKRIYFQNLSGGCEDLGLWRGQDGNKETSQEATTGDRHMYGWDGNHGAGERWLDSWCFVDLGGEGGRRIKDDSGRWVDGWCYLASQRIQGRISSTQRTPELHFEQVKLEMLLNIQEGFQGRKGADRGPGWSRNEGVRLE